MKYFKKNGEVFAFESDGSQDELITKDFVKMTKSEVDRHLNPEKYLSDDEKRKIFLSTLTPLTRRQFKLALLENDLLEKVESTIDNIPDLQLRKRMQIEYSESIEFQRQSESVLLMCGMLELSEDQVDQLWQYAMTL
ncbi:hypothetical protein MJ046_06680 [Acinetobacter bereziniae]|uniref:hypothetical protein n=1 Tax=Acinetobacter bereziniae TaxID=106648 RepID=UPI0022EB2097|nr:hypothetical protein [Acinetobacter bereziniae]MDA3440024.1 hypothetical protein [Acinetobacter bereziniae]